MTANGTWTISFQTPGGPRRADLVLSTFDSTLTGTFDGVTLEDGHAEGTNLTFAAQLTKPFKVKIRCTAVVDGDTITGKAKAAIMTFPFTGTRTSA